MEVKIHAIHFDIADKLVSFINKKAERLARHNVNISTVDVTLKVVKPETAMNKEALVKVAVPPAGRFRGHEDSRHIRRSHRPVSGGYRASA